jgi:hypothetical protein
VNGTPEQVPVGVTVYVSVAVDVLLLCKLWLILLWPVAWELPPVMAPAGTLTGAVQVYVVPSDALAGVTVNVLSLHIVAVCVGIAEFGLTTTVSVKGRPEQTPERGVTV